MVPIDGLIPRALSFTTRPYAAEMFSVISRGIAQSGRALGWGPSGRRFESVYPDHGLSGRKNHARRHPQSLSSLQATDSRPNAFKIPVPFADYSIVQSPANATFGRLMRCGLILARMAEISYQVPLRTMALK